MMEKQGIDLDSLKQGLLQEEASLMQKKQRLFVSGSEKTASESQEETQIDSRISELRAKINEIDLEQKQV